MDTATADRSSTAVRGGRRPLRSRLRSAARRARDLCPLTLPGGLMLAAAGLALWRLGMGRLDLVVLAAAALGGGATVLLALGVSATAAVLALRVRRLPVLSLAADCGIPLPTGFVLPLPRWLPLLEASWTWEAPAAVEVGARPVPGGLAEVATARRRGRFERIVRRVAVRDAAGLAEITLTLATAAEVRFTPHAGSLRSLTVLEGLTAGEELSDPHGEPFGDPIDMRRYTHGDSPRLILWKVFARSRKLLVRLPERAVAARRRTCAYLVAGPGDEASAALARAVVEQGLLGEGWRFGADGSAEAAHTETEALDTLVASGRAAAGAAVGLGDFLRRAERDGFAHCVLFLPPRPGPWLEPTAAAARATRLRPLLLTAVDGAGVEAPPTPRWRRLLLLPRGGASPPADLHAVAAPFVGMPSRMVAVDRATGRVLGDPRLAVATRGRR